MKTWAYFINFLLPLPLVALLLDALPFPLRVQRFVHMIIDKVLFTSMVGKLNFYQLATSLSLLAFLYTAMETSKERTTPNKWRFERNFWISAFSLTLWLILRRMHQLSGKYSDLLQQQRTAEDLASAMADVKKSD